MLLIADRVLLCRVVRVRVFNVWLSCPADTHQSPIRIKAVGRCASASFPAPGASAPQKTVGTQPCPIHWPPRRIRRDGRTDSWFAAPQAAPTRWWFTAEAYPPRQSTATFPQRCTRSALWTRSGISPTTHRVAGRLMLIQERNRRPNQASGSGPNPLPGSPLRPA